MQIITSGKTLSEIIYKSRYSDNKSVGYVPTMGSLHDGHLSLVRKAKEENDLVVCSIFVNPTQFNDAQDFDKYPRDNKKDIALLESVACDYLFLPSKEEMYPNKIDTSIDFGALGNKMEGAFRPGHFNGVGQVLSKLFHFVPANKSYFGQKDLQQYLIVQQMIRDLFFATEIVLCPISRENNGLAMSSRNERLSIDARAKASILNQILGLVQKEIISGQTIAAAVSKGKTLLEKDASFKLEYLDVVELPTLNPALTKTSASLAICIAAHIESVRLIDNLIIE